MKGAFEGDAIFAVCNDAPKNRTKSILISSCFLLFLSLGVCCVCCNAEQRLAHTQRETMLDGDSVASQAAQVFDTIKTEPENKRKQKEMKETVAKKEIKILKRRRRK